LTSLALSCWAFAGLLDCWDCAEGAALVATGVVTGYALGAEVPPLILEMLLIFLVVV